MGDLVLPLAEARLVLGGGQVADWAWCGWLVGVWLAGWGWLGGLGSVTQGLAGRGPGEGGMGFSGRVIKM